MKFKHWVRISVMLITFFSYSQEDNYMILTLNGALKQNANAVVRNYNLEIELHNYASMTIRFKRAVTVFNEDGLKHIYPYVHHNPDTRVKSVSAKVYDAFGNEVKKFRRKDFEDYSNTGSSLFSDDRVLALDYTPTNYPFTLVFEYETSNDNTAFYPRWFPVDSYNLSTEKAVFKIINPDNVPLNIRENNFVEGIENFSSGSTVHYEANTIKALKREALSPSFSRIAPSVEVAPEKFRLIDIDGEAKDWNSFGVWSYKNLIKGRNDLSQSTISKISALVQDTKDPIEKARRIYKYVQDNTRYISVQLGVGGWQPILASKVDEVNYGDCKALTNYTMSLLKSQGIVAYYTVVYGDSSIRDIDDEFIGMQGNHVILNIPTDDEDVWLECTSQKAPFGHIANFTDDRDVFVITPQGGKIKHTKAYSSQDNYLKATAVVNIDENGGFSANYSARSGGTRYSYRLQIEDSDTKDRDLFYKDYWSYINDLTISKIEFANNYEDAVIAEDIQLSTRSYGATAGEKLLLKPNIFKRDLSSLPRYTERKQPLVIQRGYYNEDNYEINLPEGWKLENLPEPKVIETEYGKYTMLIERDGDSKIIYKRTLEIYTGEYPKEAYKDYRSFRRKITKADKASIVLSKIQ